MDLLQAIVLGIVQGLTEFLPISSSGHLRIVPAFAGWEDPGAAFTAVIQLGTMAAVVLYFCARPVAHRARLAGLAARPVAPLGQLDARMGWYLILGHGPDRDLRRRLPASDRERRARPLPHRHDAHRARPAAARRREGRRAASATSTTLTRRDAIVVGFAQALALIPGVSRSGATITAGLFLGLDRVAAARFSFLLSIPAVVLSGLYELRDVVDGSAEGAAGLAATAVATLLAFISGYLSIAFLLRFLTTHTTAVFVAYRVALGAAVLVLAGTGHDRLSRAEHRLGFDATSNLRGARCNMASVDTTAAQSTNGHGDGAEIAVENPATGEVIAHVADLSAERRRRARPRRPRRAARLAGARLRRPRARHAAHAQVVMDNADRIVATIVSETGKTYEDAYMAEINYAGGALTFWAKHAEELLADETHPRDDARGQAARSSSRATSRWA